MKVFNVEFFSRNFDFLSATQIGKFDYEIDYLDIVKNKFDATNVIAEIGGYVKITSTDLSVSGIVINLEQKENQTTVSFKDFMDILNVEIPIDTSLLKTKTMESFISDYIKAYYVTNSDTLQNIQGLSVSILSGTGSTSLSIKDKIANFYKEVIYQAFLQYKIVVKFDINQQKKTIDCVVRKNISDIQTIELDLSNIIESTIDLGIAKESVNKLYVYNEDNFAESKTYYLHADSTVSEVNSNRISPVIFEVDSVTVSGDDTFAQVSLEKALATLSATVYNNLIEVEVANDDELVKPYDMSRGQLVTLISGNTSYQSILTGKKIGETTVLVFGAIRKELTKKIKWGY